MKDIRLQAAIDELESGGGERFDTVEELFESLANDKTSIKSAALIEVTYRELLVGLGLPDDAKLVILPQAPEDILHGKLVLLLEHELLPACSEGSVPRRFTLAGVKP